MKKIGITQKIIQNKNGFCFQIDKDWFDYFSKFNANLIPLGFEKINIININKLKLDGIIISGGGNIYKKERKKSNSLRDTFEKKLITKYQDKNIPVLLVCRGFQLLGDNYGYKLEKIDNHVKRMHKVYIDKEILSQNIDFLYTNSYHDYGFKKLGKKFDILGKTKDGNIEIAKLKNKNTFCTMFHPERYNKSQIIIDKIIKQFFSI
tara:strand:+ start:144 stop:761 length:618 start_codon:yes stop_codon:yes gene_type:complete